jgi:UDP-glucuronate 4-epimerase
MLQGEKVLVAGATGQVALPLTLALGADNEVWAAARFSDQAARGSLESAGVTCVAVDLVDGDLSGLPDDFDYVLNFSVIKSNDWERDLDGNVGGVAALMHHCREMRAFLHCSSTAVYQPDGHRAFAETDPSATTIACGPSWRPTASPRSPPRRWPAAWPASSPSRRRSPA